MEEELIFRRLDRVVVNQDFMNLFPSSEVEHIIRQGLDHAPLHVICCDNRELVTKSFRFLNI